MGERSVKVVRISRVDDLGRVVVARCGEEVRVYCPTDSDLGDLEWLLEPDEIALVRLAA